MTFEEEFAVNTKEAILDSLMKTIVSTPNRTLAEVYDYVEEVSESSDRDYVAETFREITVGELVEWYCHHHGIPEELEECEEEDGEVVDLSCEGDDEGEEMDEDSGTEVEEKTIAPKRKSAAKADSDEEEGPFTDFQKMVINTLTDIGATSLDGAASSSTIRKEIEADPALLRGTMKFFITNDIVAATGERRGKKYYLTGRW